MHLNIVRESGFCHGVRAAVHKANAQSNGLIYLYGDLVNNRHVMARYIRDGFIVANDVAKIAPGSVVIIRAHGVGRDVYDALAEKNAEIVDCTCVKVKAIHKIVSGKNGVIIIGKKNHPEVLGISGWCENYIVAENSDELAAALASDDVCKAPCVVAQTTCNANFWQTAVAAIRTHRPDAEIFDTLCDVTAKRMENATEMARESDCMIIVGDEKSANSVELFKACETVCEKIFFVSEPEEIADHAPEILACKKIGIAGSASAPAETIEAIHDFLLFADFLNTAKTQIEAASDEYFAGLIEGSKNSFVESAISDLRNQNQNGKRIRGAMILLGCLVAGEGRGARPHTPQGSTAPLTPDAWASSPPLGGRPAPDIVR
ncbi:MAG: 4-hydroxy-3-methylbut-2-enyl diphosphate reductase, partial [Defluviitaleaceae bacterium]|nr:4-hydroxy-3-methylbut-2-enyl diphosphate reductase [Defluviitaleaceae bacterium]